jgi:type VI secretion system protein ImpH
VRQRQPSVKELILTEPWKFGFFQAVRVLERIFPTREGVTRAVLPGSEAVRFRSNVSLAFPASEIMELKAPPADHPDRPVEMKVNFVGLTGPLGVLPTCYTELVMERNAYKDRAMHDFLDLFHHRIVSLFYRAWEKYRFPVSYERGGEDAFTEYLFDLIGMGTPALRGRMAVPDQALLLYAGLIAQRPHSAEAIASILRDYFRAPTAIKQFEGQWFPLESANLTRIGEANCELGRTVVAGSSVFVSQSKFRVTLGPLTFAQYTSFLPVGPAWKPITDLTRYLAGLEFDFDVQLVLKKEEVPPCHLSSSAALPPMLGWTAWMTSEQPKEDASELVLPVND